MTPIRRTRHGPNIRSLTIRQLKLPGPSFSIAAVLDSDLSIAAIDPGMTTGIALFRFSHGGEGYEDQGSIYLELGQYKAEDFLQMMGRIKHAFPSGRRAPTANRLVPVVVYEKYIARPSRHGLLGAEANRQLSPVAIMGQIEGYYMAHNAMPGAKHLEMPTFVPQQASEMGNFPDKRLKAMFPDIWALTERQGKNLTIPHARDALRHLLVYLKKEHKGLYDVLKTPERAARRPTRKHAN